jgi:hypothetical protein
MPRLNDLGIDVERQMLSGERFSDVEDLINASDLSDEEKSALWLLAWSYLDHRAQRREARAHIAALAERRRRRPPSDDRGFRSSTVEAKPRERASTGYHWRTPSCERPPGVTGPVGNARRRVTAGAPRRQLHGRPDLGHASTGDVRATS